GSPLPAGRASVGTLADAGAPRGADSVGVHTLGATRWQLPHLHRHRQTGPLMEVPLDRGQFGAAAVQVVVEGAAAAPLQHAVSRPLGSRRPSALRRAPEPCSRGATTYSTTGCARQQ